MESYFMTIEELTDFLHIGRSKAYELCHKSGFPASKYGRKILINRQRLVEWLEAQEEKREDTK